MINNSQIKKIESQPDGRKYVTEEHELNDGRKIVIEYLADADLDINQKLVDRVPVLEEQLQKESDNEVLFEKIEKVIERHGEFIESLTINDAKEIFNLDTDEEAQILKDNLK